MYATLPSVTGRAARAASRELTSTMSKDAGHQDAGMLAARAEHQSWPGARREMDKGTRRVQQRCPELERRMRPIRVVMVVQKQQVCLARMQQQPVVAAGGEGGFRAPHDL
jgi:hypothetical protein